jgi:hypothetical protein
MAVTRARCDPQTRDYIARKKGEGKTNRDAIRCLKRHLAPVQPAAVLTFWRIIGAAGH